MAGSGSGRAVYETGFPSCPCRVIGPWVLAMSSVVSLYSLSDYMTPAAPDTVDLIASAAKPTSTSLLLDVACGKGAAAALLATRFQCRIVAIEIFGPFVAEAAARAGRSSVPDLISVLRSDARHIPVRDGAFDAAYCIGGPSVVGLNKCLRELSRAVRVGGYVIVSDVVWRTKPVEPLGPEWRWWAHVTPMSLAEYSAELGSAGLTVEGAVVHPPTSWEEYFEPMLVLAATARARKDPDIALAEGIEETVALERRAVAAFADYATFIGRKRES